MVGGLPIFRSYLVTWGMGGGERYGILLLLEDKGLYIRSIANCYN